jgi:hypothetical protein
MREYTVRVTPASLFPPPPPSVAAAAAAAIPPEKPRASHSCDFASVNWFGTSYAFTPTQRRIVAVLWTAWEQGTPDVSQKAVLEEAMSDSTNLRELFRGHAAWKTMIQCSSVHGGPAGCFRLAPPEDCA